MQIVRKVFTASVLVSAEKGGKAFFRAQVKEIPEYYSGSRPYPVFKVISCGVGLEAVVSEGTAERHCLHVWMPQERGRCSVEWFVHCLVML